MVIRLSRQLSSSLVVAWKVSRNLLARQVCRYTHVSGQFGEKEACLSSVESTPDSKLSPSPTPDHTVTPTVTYQPLPGYLQVSLTLVPHSSSLNVSLSSPTTTLPKSTSTSPQNQSKVNSFSISHLLAPDGPSKPTVSAPLLPSVHPSLLMFQAYYQQWYAQQVMASMRKFHGEVAELDRRSVHYSSTIQSEQKS